MLLKVKVTSSAKKIEIKKSRFFDYEVVLTKPAIDNQANKQLIEVLAKHYDLPKSNVKIKSGQSSKIKLLSIDI